MTIRQNILKAFYPILMKLNRTFGKKMNMKASPTGTHPPISFYSLKTFANDGREMNFSDFKGKKVLLVNTASDCGYTAQYHELQEIYKQYKDRLVIVGFAANDFGEQEKGSDEEIARFCQAHFEIGFPLARKSTVVKGPSQNRIFEWLTHKQENGWNDQAPEWNFAKYLVNEKGNLTHYFASSVSPLGDEMKKAINQ
jgi:glutathione peroxidase